MSPRKNISLTLYLLVDLYAFAIGCACFIDLVFVRADTALGIAFSEFIAAFVENTETEAFVLGS